LLDILEIENDAVALGEHLVDQVPLQADHIFLIGLCQLILKFICWNYVFLKA